MGRYIALLRGVNISGKNPVAMPELKKGFEALGFEAVLTYINSGNVVFSTAREDKAALVADIVAMLHSRFGLCVPVAVLRREELDELLRHAPEWWGGDDKAIYDNLILLLPPLTFAEVYAEIGDAKPEYEKIDHYEGAIYWSFVRKDYAKTRWIQTASSRINDRVTLRTANTMRKLQELAAR